MGCLYKLTSPSGKSYIGITSFSLEKRWKEHVGDAYSGRYGALFSAIRKYGPNTFTIQIVRIEDDWPTLCALERDAIQHFGTFGHGYNATPGGDGVIEMTEESRKRHKSKTSEGTRKAWANGTLRAHRAEAWLKPGAREQHSQATAKGTALAFSNPEVRKRLKESRQRPEYRDIIRKKVTLLWSDPDYRAKQLAKRRARSPRSTESKSLQSLKMKDLIAKRKSEGTYWVDSIRKSRKKWARS